MLKIESDTSPLKTFFMHMEKEYDAFMVRLLDIFLAQCEQDFAEKDKIEELAFYKEQIQKARDIILINTPDTIQALEKLKEAFISSIKLLENNQPANNFNIVLSALIILSQGKDLVPQARNLKDLCEKQIQDAKEQLSNDLEAEQNSIAGDAKDAIKRNFSEEELTKQSDAALKSIEKIKKRVLEKKEPLNIKLEALMKTYNSGGGLAGAVNKIAKINEKLTSSNELTHKDALKLKALLADEKNTAAIKLEMLLAMNKEIVEFNEFRDKEISLLQEINNPYYAEFLRNTSTEKRESLQQKYTIFEQKTEGTQDKMSDFFQNIQKDFSSLTTVLNQSSILFSNDEIKKMGDKFLNRWSQEMEQLRHRSIPPIRSNEITALLIPMLTGELQKSVPKPFSDANANFEMEKAEALSVIHATFFYNFDEKNLHRFKKTLDRIIDKTLPLVDKTIKEQEELILKVNELKKMHLDNLADRMSIELRYFIEKYPNISWNKGNLLEDERQQLELKAQEIIAVYDKYKIVDLKNLTTSDLKCEYEDLIRIKQAADELTDEIDLFKMKVDVENQYKAISDDLEQACIEFGNALIEKIKQEAQNDAWLATFFNAYKATPKNVTNLFADFYVNKDSFFLQKVEHNKLFGINMKKYVCVKELSDQLHEAKAKGGKPEVILNNFRKAFKTKEKVFRQNIDGPTTKFLKFIARLFGFRPSEPKPEAETKPEFTTRMHGIFSRKRPHEAAHHHRHAHKRSRGH